MKILCAWMAVLSFLVGVSYSVQKENVEYMFTFILGVMFVICIWVAVTI